MTKATSGTMVSGSSLYSWVEVTNWSEGENTITFNIRGGVESDYGWAINCTTYLQWEENGTTYDITSGSGYFSGYDTITLASTSDYFTRQSSDRSVKLKAYSTCSLGSATASLSYTVPAKNVTDFTNQRYTVIYNVLGGRGAPPSQEKVYGTNLTLSTTTPTKPGYTFNGWNTKKDGTGTDYAAGATYSSDACLVLFAKWVANDSTAMLQKFIDKTGLETIYNNIKNRFIPTDMADYIVDMGGADNWIWIKWNSGKSECWANYYNTYPITGSWGALYESSNIYATFPSGIFNSTPYFCHVSFAPAAGSYFVFAIENGPDLSATTTQKVMLLRPTSNSSNVKGYVQFYACGTWK